MTTQNDINKDMVSLVGSLSDGINQLRKAVELMAHEINDIKSSQNIRNENFNDRLINLEENKIKVIDEELKRIDTLEQAFNREF
jgi:hypothetical protein